MSSSSWTRADSREVKFLGEVDVGPRATVGHPKLAALSHGGLELVGDHSPVNVEQRVDEEQCDPAKLVFIRVLGCLDDRSEGLGGVAVHRIDVAVPSLGVMKTALVEGHFSRPRQDWVSGKV